ncbi:MAG: hypothetical protein IKZ08_02455 [Bacteroidales bacterium]|nr:hypothetical protein [Bacteroidales bacterium]
MISIKGLDKAKVLKALYDASHVQGMGWLQAAPDGYVTVEHCRELLNEGQYYFDYLYGKVLKVNLSGDEFDERLYDRDNGSGAARRVIDILRRMNNKNVFGEVFVDTARLNIRIDTDRLSPSFTIRFGDTQSISAMISILEDLRDKMEVCANYA